MGRVRTVKLNCKTPIVKQESTITDQSSSAQRCSRLVLATAILCSCLIAGSSIADDEVHVVASIKPVHSLVSIVMAGVGEPYLIIQGNSSPHNFRMRPSDAAKLQDAHIIFLIDRLMETSLAEAIDAHVGNARVARVIELSEAEGLVRWKHREGGAFEGHGHEGEESLREDTATPSESTFDLHNWLDPVNAVAMVKEIADILSEADTTNAELYDANAQSVLHRLNELTTNIASEMIPVRNRSFIVFHDGYRYFEERFGLTAAGSSVVNPNRSLGAKRLKEIRDMVQEHGVSCVFVEPQFDQGFVEVVIEGTQALVGTLDPLGAHIEDGPDLYFNLLRNLSASFRDCLTSAEQSAE